MNRKLEKLLELAAGSPNVRPAAREKLERALRQSKLCFHLRTVESWRGTYCYDCRKWV